MHRRTIFIIVAGVTTTIAVGALACMTQVQGLQRSPQSRLNTAIWDAAQCPDTFTGELMFEKARIDARSIDPVGEVMCLTSYAEFCLKSGKLEKAESLLRQSRELSARNKFCLFDTIIDQLANVLEQQHRLNDAELVYLEAFKETCDKDGQSPISPHLIMFYRRTEQLESEKSFLERLFNSYSKEQLSSERQSIIWDLAEIAIKNNEYAEAEKWLNRLKEPNFVALTNLAWCQAKSNRPKDADRSFKEALQKLKTNTQTPIDEREAEFQIRVLYAEFLDSIGRNTEAQTHKTFCNHMAKVFPSTPTLDVLYPKDRPRLARDSSTGHQLGKAGKSNTNIAKGLRYFYGHIIDKETGLRDAVDNAPSNEKVYHLCFLCAHQLKAKKLDAAVETAKELLSCAGKYNSTNSLYIIRTVQDALIAANKSDIALDLMHREINAYRQSLGDKECMSIFALDGTAEVFFFQKKYETAIDLMRQAQTLHAQREREQVACSFCKANALKLIASSYTRLDKPAEAQKAYEQLLPESRWYSNTFESFGNIIQDLEEYADICRTNGDSKNADLAIAEARSIKSKHRNEPDKLKLGIEGAYSNNPAFKNLTDAEF